MYKFEGCLFWWRVAGVEPSSCLTALDRFMNEVHPDSTVLDSREVGVEFPRFLTSQFGRDGSSRVNINVGESFDKGFWMPE